MEKIKVDLSLFEEVGFIKKENGKTIVHKSMEEAGLDLEELGEITTEEFSLNQEKAETKFFDIMKKDSILNNDKKTLRAMLLLLTQVLSPKNQIYYWLTTTLYKLNAEEDIEIIAGMLALMASTVSKKDQMLIVKLIPMGNSETIHYLLYKLSAMNR